MPTQSLETLLNRDLSKVAAKEIIEIASPLLQELVNYSTNAFVRCATSASGEVNEDLAVLMLYLHIIEMTDGIEVLISQSCPVPAIPLLRSTFEALISIEYILKEDYTRRSLAWITEYAHQHISMYRLFDLTSSQGKEFQKIIEKDEFSKYWRMPAHEIVIGWIANLQHLLDRPQFQSIEEEFKNLKSRRSGGNPPWHKLFGGPSSIQQLAIRVDRAGQYEMLYRNWSSIAHGHDLSRYITRTEEGEQAIKRLRNAERLAQVATFTAYIIFDATRLMLTKFRPGENLSKWYTEEVRERYNALYQNFLQEKRA